MDADPAVSADLVLVALDAPRSHPPPALPCHVTLAGPVRSTPERTAVGFREQESYGSLPVPWRYHGRQRGGLRPVDVALITKYPSGT